MNLINKILLNICSKIFFFYEFSSLLISKIFMFYYVYDIILFVYVRILVDMVNVSDNFIDFVFIVYEVIYVME